MLTKIRLSKRAIIRKLDKSIRNSEIEKKFNAVLDEKEINTRVFLTGATKDTPGYLGMQVGIKKTIDTNKFVLSYVVFRELANVPLLKNVSKFNYGVILLIENNQYLYSYLESFPNISSWLDGNSSFIGITQLKKVFSGKVEFKSVSIRNPKPTMFEVSGLSLDGKNVKSNVGVFAKERQVLQRISTASSAGNLTVDVSKEKIKASGARENITDYLKWIVELSSSLESISKVTPATNSFFDGFMKVASEKEIEILKPKKLFINESFLGSLFSDKDKHFSIASKNLKSSDIKNILSYFNSLNKLDSYSKETQVSLLGKIYYVNAGFIFLSKKNIFEIVFKNFPKVIVQDENGSESLFSYLNTNEAFGLSFDNSDFVQLGRNIYKSSLLKNKAKSISEILKPKEFLFDVECEKFKNKTKIAKLKKFPKKSVFYVTEECLKKDKNNNVFLDDMGNEWCDYLSYNLKRNEIQFVHCKYKAKPNDKDHSVSATNFQDVLGQAQKNIGNILHGDKFIEKKIKTKISGNKFKGSNIFYDRNQKKQSSSTYYDQYLEVFNSVNRRIKVIIAINFISKKSFIDDVESEVYNSNPYFWQQIYFLISASEFYRQLGIDFEVWCGE